MSTWILILTIAASDSRVISAISTVPGFQSENNCLVAGNAWIQQTRPKLTVFATSLALCVEQRMKP